MAVVVVFLFSFFVLFCVFNNKQDIIFLFFFLNGQN